MTAVSNNALSFFFFFFWRPTIDLSCATENRKNKGLPGRIQRMKALVEKGQKKILAKLKQCGNNKSINNTIDVKLEDIPLLYLLLKLIAPSNLKNHLPFK